MPITTQYIRLMTSIGLREEPEMVIACCLRRLHKSCSEMVNIIAETENKDVYPALGSFQQILHAFEKTMVLSLSCAISKQCVDRFNIEGVQLYTQQSISRNLVPLGLLAVELSSVAAPISDSELCAGVQLVADMIDGTVFKIDCFCRRATRQHVRFYQLASSHLAALKLRLTLNEIQLFLEQHDKLDEDSMAHFDLVDCAKTLSAKVAQEIAVAETHFKKARVKLRHLPTSEESKPFIDSHFLLLDRLKRLKRTVDTWSKQQSNRVWVIYFKRVKDLRTLGVEIKNLLEDFAHLGLQAAQLIDRQLLQEHVAYYAKPFGARAEAVSDVCSICLEEYGKGDLVSESACGHILHTRCLREWASRSDKCPSCRKCLI